MALRTLAAVLLGATPNEQVRWISPPRGTLRHGYVWVTHPRVVAVVTIVLVIVILSAALYGRFRRR